MTTRDTDEEVDDIIVTLLTQGEELRNAPDDVVQPLISQYRVRLMDWRLTRDLQGHASNTISIRAIEGTTPWTVNLDEFLYRRVTGDK